MQDTRSKPSQPPEPPPKVHRPAPGEHPGDQSDFESQRDFHNSNKRSNPEVSGPGEGKSPSNV
jgi:hypothetical protein